MVDLKEEFHHYWIYTLFSVACFNDSRGSFSASTVPPFQARAEFLLYLRKSYGNEVRISAMGMVMGLWFDCFYSHEVTVRWCVDLFLGIDDDLL